MFRRLRIAEVASMIWEPGNDVATITDPRPDLLLRNEAVSELGEESGKQNAK